MTSRRSFLSMCLALGAAPALARAASLMPVRATDAGVLVPRWATEPTMPWPPTDTAAWLQSLIDAGAAAGQVVNIPPGRHTLERVLVMRSNANIQFAGSILAPCTPGGILIEFPNGTERVNLNGLHVDLTGGGYSDSAAIVVHSFQINA